MSNNDARARRWSSLTPPPCCRARVWPHVRPGRRTFFLCPNSLITRAGGARAGGGGGGVGTVDIGGAVVGGDTGGIRCSPSGRVRLSSKGSAAVGGGKRCCPIGRIQSSSNAGRKKSPESSADESRFLRGVEDSIAREFFGLADAETFAPVKQRVENVIDARWVFEVKSDALGHITKLKSRLCAKGFRQREHVDFGETFAPTFFFSCVGIGFDCV